MTSTSGGGQPVVEPQHLDLIEFCLAEFDISEQETGVQTTSTVWWPGSQSKQKQQQMKENELIAVNRRKWPPNRIVNYELLARFKKTFLRFYNDYNRHMLLFEIDEVNKFTSYLELDRIFVHCTSGVMTNTANTAAGRGTTCEMAMLAAKRKLIVDTRTLNTLQRKLELNWFRVANSLYPIKTIGDGNCLVFVVSLLNILYFHSFDTQKNTKIDKTNF